MKKIELVNGIYSSAIGFGCAPILGSVEGKIALRALECAFDNGINHFDLARSYGYGEAERFVGKVMKGRRDKVVLASKFGIVANWKAALLKPAKPLLRVIKKRKSIKTNSLIVTNSAVNVADHFHNRLPINCKEMKKSLENSLKALNTDYLDYFFVHEPLKSIEHFDELLAMAEKLKFEGKIRAFGLAYMLSQESFHRSYLDKFDLLQFNNSSNHSEYQDMLLNRGSKSNIIFSPLRGITDDLTPFEKLTKLSNDFPNSVILCSAFNEKHIKENALLFTK